MSKLRKLIDDTLVAIDDDRKDAKALLDDVAQELSKNADKYREIGMVAAKYMETMQRSNEQRVKLISIMAKKSEEDEFGDVSADEATEMYEDFEEEEAKDGT